MIRVAIAEDDPGCARQLEQLLREFGRESGRTFQITCYDNGEDLLEQYRPNCGLIFLDIEMSFVDGLTVAKRIRQIAPIESQKNQLLFYTAARVHTST